MYVRDTMQRRLPWEEYVVLEVDESKIPCECWVADNDLANEIFDLAMELYPSEYERPKSEEEEWEIQAEMERLAKKYYQGMEKYDPRKRKTYEGVEVLCPCDIPASAVIRVL